MKCYFLLLILLLLSYSCKNDPKVETPAEMQRISNRLQYQAKDGALMIKSGKFDYSIKRENLPVKKAVVLNASLIGYFTELEAYDRITGVSSPEYIYSEKVLNLISNGKIQNVGNEQKYDMEKIIALQPDVVFTNYISVFENTYEILKKNGITVVFLDEYLENNPVEKTKYLELFGELLGKQDLARKKVSDIEAAYHQLKSTAEKSINKPTVIANEMYGNQWYMPGGKTQLANLISDAGGNYILKQNSENRAVPQSFEEVFTKSQTATVWVNAGNHFSKRSLLQINPNYAKMNVFNNGKIYSITGKTRNKANDFFESGVVRADLVLKDYIKIMQPKLVPDYQFTYLKEIK